MAAATRAQNTRQVPKVGFLFPGPAAAANLRFASFLEGLQSLGYRAPEQVEVVLRVTGGDPARIVPMVAEIVDAKVDVIVPVSPAAVRAARAATATMAIVAHDLETDPVGSGLVASLAHPGGNITGYFFDFPDFAMKWLELMREAIPHALNSPTIQSFEPTFVRCP